MLEFKDKDKEVAITVAARGIGKEIAKCFKNEGAKVEIIDILEGDYFVDDLAKKEDKEKFVNYVLEKHGSIDYLT